MSNSKLGTNPSKWLESVADIRHLALPEEPVKRILKLKEKESWTLVRDDITEVTESGPLGKKLFGFALRAIAESRIATVVEEASHEIWNMNIISHKTLAAAIRDTEAKLAAITEANCLDGPRARSRSPTGALRWRWR